MNTVKCSCGYDSGKKAATSSYNVGAESRRLGMTFIMTGDGEHVWLCGDCTKVVREAGDKICRILGTTFWTSTSVISRELLEDRG